MIERPNRGAWLAASGALVAATSFAGRQPARAQNAGVLHAAGSSTEGLSEGYYAEDLGLFKAHGLNVDMRHLNTAATIAPAIASGDLDIGCGNVLVVGQAHAHNIPFVIIAAAEIHDPQYQTSAMIVAKNSPIVTPKDLNGKSVAVSTLNGMEQLSSAALIDRSGGDISTVKFIELPPPTVAEAVASGRVDAAELPEPELSAASDRTRKIGSGDDALGAFSIHTVWYTRRSWLDANKDAAQRFVAAIYAAGAWATANPDKAGLVLQKYLGVKEPRAYARFAPKANLAGIQAIYDAGAKYKFLPPINAAEFVWDGK
jgi:NitT/TauT family transport system substrate-binding protein